MGKQEEINALAMKLSQLVDAFRKGEPAQNTEWWQLGSPKIMFDPHHGYQDSQPLYDEVVQGILKLNSDMLSEFEVNNRIIYKFLEPQTIKVFEPSHLYNQDLIDEAKKQVSELIEFKQWQDLEFAIAHLRLDGEPIKLGEVTFLPVTKEEIEKWKKQGYCPASIDNVKVVACVKSPGDEQKALSYARIKVSLVLDLIRAFCFPFGKDSDKWTMGFPGDVDASHRIPIRRSNNTPITIVGNPIGDAELYRMILNKLDPKYWELLNELILKSNPNNIESKLIDSIHWLAEATKPDTNNAKFIKIGVGLETLLGKEPKDEDLKVRGITAMLAERAAFVAGKDVEDRLKIDKDIRVYYGQRSHIVHGGEKEVSFEDIDKFGELVRRLGLAVLEKLNELRDEISDVDKLEKWVKKQRYTLGESERDSVPLHKPIFPRRKERGPQGVRLVNW